MDNLLDIAGSSGGDVETLGEQRRYADVASDLARSRVFTSVLLDTGRLAAFLQGAVAVLSRAAADVSGRLLPNRAVTGRSPQQQQQRQQQWVTYPEPLLRALCSFCLEHSPARSIFIKALLEITAEGATAAAAAPSLLYNVNGSDDAGLGGDASENRSSSATPSPPAGTTEPCAALFLLCLHPHPPSAAAASTLLQCLLVGGGALGAVSGPSPGAAAGVGVIPAGFTLTPVAGGGGGGDTWGRGGGIGREDPLQAALLERIGAVALGGGRCGGDAEDSRSYGGGGPFPQIEQQSAAAVGADGEGTSFFGEEPRGIRDRGGRSSGSDIDDDDGDDDWEAWIRCGFDDGGLASPPAAAGVTPGESHSHSPPPMWPGALKFLLARLGQIGGGLAAASANQQLGLAEPGGSSSPGGVRGGAPPYAAQEEAGGGRLKARAVELEQELTSVLCLLSSLVSLFFWRSSLPAATVCGRFRFFLPSMSADAARTQEQSDIETDTAKIYGSK